MSNKKGEKKRQSIEIENNDGNRYRRENYIKENWKQWEETMEGEIKKERKKRQDMDTKWKTDNGKKIKLYQYDQNMKERGKEINYIVNK